MDIPARKGIFGRLRAGQLAQGLDLIFESYSQKFSDSRNFLPLNAVGRRYDCGPHGTAYLQNTARVFPGDPPEGPAAAKIFIIHQQSEFVDAWPVWDLPVFNEREVEAELRSTQYRLHYFDDLNFWQLYDKQNRRGLQLMAGPDCFPLWDPDSPLRNFIHWTLLDVGMGLVHAGTLAIESKGIVLAGKGGSGKSGTVIAGLLHGLQSVGDDYVAASFDDRVQAHKVYPTLKQDSTGADRLNLADLAESVNPKNWQGKHIFNLDRLADNNQPQSIAVGATCLPRITNATRTTFERVASKNAFLALAPSGVSQIPAARPEMISICAKLVRELPAYSVNLGTDPMEISDSIRAFIEDLQT